MIYLYIFIINDIVICINQNKCCLTLTSFEYKPEMANASA